jgi:hypothetical protein
MPAESEPIVGTSLRPGLAKAAMAKAAMAKASLAKVAMSMAALLCIAACATCKSTDTIEQCRTKQRNHAQPRALAPDAAGTQLPQPVGS